MCLLCFTEAPCDCCNSVDKSVRHVAYVCRRHLLVRSVLTAQASRDNNNNNNNNNNKTSIGLSPGGSGYFTCIENMKLVTNKFKLGGLHEKHVVATWSIGNHLSICL